MNYYRAASFPCADKKGFLHAPLVVAGDVQSIHHEVDIVLFVAAKRHVFFDVLKLSVDSYPAKALRGDFFKKVLVGTFSAHNERGQYDDERAFMFLIEITRNRVRRRRFYGGSAIRAVGMPRRSEKKSYVIVDFCDGSDG